MRCSANGRVLIDFREDVLCSTRADDRWLAAMFSF